MSDHMDRLGDWGDTRPRVSSPETAFFLAVAAHTAHGLLTDPSTFAEAVRRFNEASGGQKPGLVLGVAGPVDPAGHPDSDAAVWRSAARFMEQVIHVTGIQGDLDALAAKAFGSAGEAALDETETE